MDAYEHIFPCPLLNGLHARPASQLVEVAARFTAEITLTNERTSAVANAKSVLALVGIDVRRGDRCRFRLTGADAGAAHAALGQFINEVLPGCDEPLPAVPTGADLIVPRTLRKAAARWFAGTPACPGVGRGIVVMAGGLALPPELAQEPAGSREEEGEKIVRAMDAVRTALQTRLAARPSATETGILQAYLAIVTDLALNDKIAELIAAGCSAGQAILHASQFFAARLKAAESAYVRERAVDVEDIALQMLEEIYAERFKPPPLELTQPSIVAAENITPRQLLGMDRRLLKALVLEHGGVTSHAVILARSFNIPTLTGVPDVRAHLPVGREAIVDASLGIVVVEVTPAVQRYYERAERKLARGQERYARFVNTPAETRDGQRLEVAANVATAEEAAPAFAQGADGIGLFRTEMLFMDRSAAPSEEEQFAAFVQAARAADGRPIIIRTVDIGGDKPIPYLDLPQEANPFLGYRGVRIYPAYRELFDAQLRAILRASAFGKMWLMIPMVCSIEEVRWVKARLAEVQAELKVAGVAFDPSLPVGIMVEVPSAAFLIDQLAGEVAFFSIGTNDLTQYFLAVDRDGGQAANLYSDHHPAFLRLLAKIVDDVHRHGRWVGLCGEMARDARNLSLLVGLGLDEISTTAPQIAALKSAVAELSGAECRALLDDATTCRTVAEVDDLLASFRPSGAAGGLLEENLILVGSDAADKEEAIEEIVAAFHEAGRTDCPLAVEEAVWTREAVYSTGLGHGFAVPHCKTDAVAANSIGVLRLTRPIEWGSTDGRPVQCVILLAMRESDKDETHMKVFSKLARRLMHEEFRDRLLMAADRDVVRRCLAEELGI